LEPTDDDADDRAFESGSEDVREQLDVRNFSFNQFDEPMDISLSMDDLKAVGVDLSEIIEIDFSKTNDSWMDVTLTSTVGDEVSMV